MGMIVKFIRQEPKTGRLIYRRAFPQALRLFLANPRREMKVPLLANSIQSPGVLDRYADAHRDFDREVHAATVAMQLARKVRDGTYDTLTSELSRYLIAVWKSDDLALDDEVRWMARPVAIKLRRRDAVREGIREDLAEALELRGLGDYERIVHIWGDEAVVHAAA